MIPYLLSPDCQKQIDWLKVVFDGEAKQIIHTNEKKEKIMHSEVVVNGGLVYLSDGPAEQQGESENDAADTDAKGFLLTVEVEDPHPIWKKAMANGCTAVTDLKVQFWGDLYGTFRDPFGFEWAVTKQESRKPGVVINLITPSGECKSEIEWLKTVFGAEVKDLYTNDDGKVMHCSMAVNGAFVYLCDDPNTQEGKPGRLVCHMDLPDPHAVWQIAADNGATMTTELKIQFWGSLYGRFKDTLGFEWSVSKAEEEKKSTISSGPGVTPYLYSPDCDKHVEWLKNVFGGELKDIYRRDDNKVLHCSVEINGGTVFLADGACAEGKKQDSVGEPRGFACHLAVTDPRLIWKKAMGNGADVVMELKVQFWGDLYGSFRDPFGCEWAVCKCGGE